MPSSSGFLQRKTIATRALATPSTSSSRDPYTYPVITCCTRITMHRDTGRSNSLSEYLHCVPTPTQHVPREVAPLAAQCCQRDEREISRAGMPSGHRRTLNSKSRLVHCGARIFAHSERVRESFRVMYARLQKTQFRITNLEWIDL